VSDPVRLIADAVLYEGYILWPYRRSALKNTRRWTFGGVHPREHSERHPDDAWRMRTECLVCGPPGAKLDVRVRCLQVVRRQVHAARAAGLEPVDALVVAGQRHLSWEEATEREFAATGLELASLSSPHRLPIAVPGERREEQLLHDGRPEGMLVRTNLALEGEIVIAAERLGDELHRVSVAIANTTAFPAGSREQALERTLCSTHTVLRAHGGRFVSLTDPPADLSDAAGACHNEGTWPVLVGEPGDDDLLLSSPIILEDHPRVAPESPGDLFDGGEIDELLTLNVLSLTDEEKAEMRDSDPRTRAILERTEGLSEEELMRLHGAIRDLRHVS
jgi:hypothetical protein